MSNEVQIFETEVLTLEEKTELGKNIDSLIDSFKQNRQAINRLAFESVAAMTEADSAATELSRKGTLSRWIGGITGSNQKLQNEINKNRSVAQYAAQQTLQKLAEQNLMSFDLIAAVNNKLNASLNKIDNNFINIYANLKKFFCYSQGKIYNLEDQLAEVEHNQKLDRWNITITRRTLGDVQYRYLSDVPKIVCLARDFYDITKGAWKNSDLDLLMVTMEKVGIKPDKKINYFNTIKEIAYNDTLKEKLLAGNNIRTVEDPGYLITMSALMKLEACRTEEKYIIDTISGFLKKNGVTTNEDKICEELTKKYLADKAFVNVDMDVECYDFVLDLLFNLQQISDIANNINNAIPQQKIDYIVANKDSEETRESIEKCEADHSYEQAMSAYENCDGIKKYEESFPLFKKASDLGDIRATGRVGEYYYNVKHDYKNAISFFEKAAKKQDALSEYYLGLMYHKGNGVAKDYAEAVKWYKKAAEQGDVDAQYNLGTMYCYGQGAPQDSIVAAQWYLKAAEQGFALAQNSLGDMYYSGQVVPQNFTVAVKWYKKAAEQGLANAQNNLGDMYYNGEGVTQDFTEAAKWYQKAAEQGNVVAQNNLQSMNMKKY